MSNKITVWFLALGCIWFTSCHKKHLSKGTSRPAIDSSFVTTDSLKSDSVTANTIEPVKVNEVEFDYLLTKSKFSFRSSTQDFDNTNVNIRIKKDSLIWLSVTGIGFEVARGLITPDSIVFLDKLHKEYFVFTYAQLSKQYNFDLNFKLLQSVIVGNLPISPGPDSKFFKENEFFLINQKSGRITVDNFIGEKNLKLERLKVVEAPTNNTFTLNYEDFREVNTFLFPFGSMINLDVQSQKDKQFYQTTMRIKHNKVELVSKDPGFPFSIPSSYTRKGKK
jgi:hypothetical protein